MSEFVESEINPKPASRRLGEEELADNGAVEFQCVRSERSEIPDPLSAADNLPSWFRDLVPKLEDEFYGSITTVKMCMPFTEAISGGWLLRAPERIHLRKRGTSLEVVNDGEVEHVRNLNTDNPGEQGNSRLFKPDVLVDTRWAVNVPDGYGALIMPPMNRNEWGFDPMSYFYTPDGDAEDLPTVDLAAYLWDDEIVIEKGDVIACVYPIPDDTCDELVLGPATDESDMKLLNDKLGARKSMNGSFFRKELWVPREKPIIEDNGIETDGGQDEPAEVGGQEDALKAVCPETGEEGDVSSCPYTRTKERFRDTLIGKYLLSDEAGDEGSEESHQGGSDSEGTGVGSGRASDGGYETERGISITHEPSAQAVAEYNTGEECELWGTDLDYPPEDVMQALCHEEYHGVVPEPKPTTYHIRDWHRRMDEVIPEIGESEFPIRESVVQAMSLGLTFEYAADVQFTWNGDDYDQESGYDRSSGRFQGRDRMNIDDHGLNVYTADSPWRFRTPKHFSSLCTSPLNHFQERWRATSGIMDSDKYFDSSNAPGLLNADDKQFVMKRGMPTIQYIPFDRRKTIYRGEITHREAE